MNNSTIIRKKKKCKLCGLPSFIFSRGRCERCARIEDSQKRLAEHEDQEYKKPKKYNAELERWFKERRKEMKGFCSHCGGRSCKYDDRWYKASIAHILPKAYFPSVATHKSNWVELCFWKGNCHGNMDNKIFDLTEMACWDTIVIRFQEIYPSIDKKERRMIPQILLQYIEVDL